MKKLSILLCIGLITFFVSCKTIDTSTEIIYLGDKETAEKWIANNIKYDEGIGGEWQLPSVTEERKKANCQGYAFLLASAMVAIKKEVKIIWLGQISDPYGAGHMIDFIDGQYIEPQTGLVCDMTPWYVFKRLTFDDALSEAINSYPDKE